MSWLDVRRHDHNQAPGGDEGAVRILLIDDHPGLRDVMQLMLEMHGYKVVAADGSIADFEIAICRAGRIDLMITDAVLPETTGPALAEKLAKQSPATKVLYVSGHSEDMLVELGYLKNGCSFLQKPFTHQEIGQKVRDILNPPLGT